MRQGIARRAARRTVEFLIAAILVTGIAGQASAQERREGWRDRDIHRFHDRDFDYWRTGHWFEGRHRGRAGWWWVVGGVWYYYPAPVYPYPDPFQPPVMVAPAPVPPPPRQLYYFCDRPRGYYPYVPACTVPWRAVPG
jgi:hypothetical protein